VPTLILLILAPMNNGHWFRHQMHLNHWFLSYLTIPSNYELLLSSALFQWKKRHPILLAFSHDIFFIGSWKINFPTIPRLTLHLSIPQPLSLLFSLLSFCSKFEQLAEFLHLKMDVASVLGSLSQMVYKSLSQLCLYNKKKKSAYVSLSFILNSSSVM